MLEGQLGPLSRGARHLALLLALALIVLGVIAARAAAQPTLTIQTDNLAGPPLMGLGVEWDPYDSFVATPAQWALTFQRLDFMRPGFMRIVEPAGDYFKGYDANHNPLYKWTAPHVVELLTMLGYTKSRDIPVVLGDWSNPMINGDARIPANFIAQLRNVYGYTNIRYYDPINEPNYSPNCDFGCWTGVIEALARQFQQTGVQLVGPGNANSWDDTAVAQSLDRKYGLDTDNPIGGDSWLTYTLQSIPGLLGAYDSHRYATIWGVENGVYEDQMRARREQINNLVSPNKPYFEGEVGLTARQVTPFSADDAHLARDSAQWQLLAQLVDPSAQTSASSFVDSQPHIREFAYGVWMGDMMIQGISGGLAGASAWDLDDAMHVGGQYGSQNLKQWGFWNSLGGLDGYPTSDLQLRPWFYSWSVLSRSFPPGSQALTVPSTGVPGLRVMAAKIPASNGYDLSFAVVNDSDTPRQIILSVPSVTRQLTLTRYDYFAGDRPVDSNAFPVPAQVLPDAQISGGLLVQLPSRGLVVWTSIGTGATTLTSATTTTVDNLSNWSQVVYHSKRLRLDHRKPLLFDGDVSRATPTRKGAQSIIYRVANLASFELKAYFNKTLGLRVYGSPDGHTWTPIGVETTNPAPSIGGGGWNLVEMLPSTPLPPGTSQLKIALTTTRTELSQVILNAR
jgi:hypothetical protein